MGMRSCYASLVMVYRGWGTPFPVLKAAKGNLTSGTGQDSVKKVLEEPEIRMYLNTATSTWSDLNFIPV